MITVLILIVIFYLIIIGSLIIGFDKVPEFFLEEKSSRTKFSIVIPFRNESQNLPLLLASLTKLEYAPQLFEILFIDDESTDNSTALIDAFKNASNFSVKIIKNVISSKSPKKDAIRIGVSEAQNNWIITTDADCKVPPYWLQCYDVFIVKNNTEMIVGPVIYINSATFLDRFQALDNLSLQSATIGGFGLGRPFLCNGANFAYTQDLFKNLDGFDGNDSVASGDDIFLLQKAISAKKDVHYIKSEHCIVRTMAQPNLKHLLAQRVRWASKTKRYTSVFPKIVALVVFLMNAIIIIALILSIMGQLRVETLLAIFVIKISLDFLLLFKSARQYNKETLLLSYLPASFIYPFFTLWVIITSTFIGYKWKDRRFKT